MTINLGSLTRIDLREVWRTEAQDFTPWLAREENLTVLGETLNMELELEAQEVSVGPFSADILCKNTDDDSWALIENQLERTDHRHLGQLLTYAAGLHTVNIVWIAQRFTEEHRAALDWLNEITDVEFRFFGLEVELWRIGESEPAPKFNIVSKPNDWSKSIGRGGRRFSDGALSDTQKLQVDYWSSLRAYGETNGSKLRFRSPQGKSWYNFGIGRTYTNLISTVNIREQRLSVGFESYYERNKAFFDLLFLQKESIEHELGFALEWNRLNDKRMSWILYSMDGDVEDQSRWPEFHEWMITHLEKLDEVFRPRVKAINLDEWVAPESDGLETD